MTTVEMLRAWYDARGRGDLIFDFSVGEGGTSAWLDVEGEQAIGRATVWNSGLCDIEAIAVSDERQLVYLHMEVQAQADLDAVLETLVLTVRENAVAAAGTT